MAVSPLLGLSISELGAKIRSGETSPTALARVAIEALDSAGRELNAVATIMEERAMQAAERAEAELASGHDRGPLHGIPWGAKDLLAAVGAPTTWGATPFRDQVFEGRTRPSLPSLLKKGVVVVDLNREAVADGTQVVIPSGQVYLGDFLHSYLRF